MPQILIAYRNDEIDVAGGPAAAYEIEFTRPDSTPATQEEADAILDALGVARVNPRNQKRATSKVGERYDVEVPGCPGDGTYTVTLARDDGRSFAKNEVTSVLATLAMQRYEAHRTIRQAYVCVGSEVVDRLREASAEGLHSWVEVMSKVEARGQDSHIALTSNRGAQELVRLGLLIAMGEGDIYKINQDLCFRTTDPR